jgi:hypothetical protein
MPNTTRSQLSIKIADVIGTVRSGTRETLKINFPHLTPGQLEEGIEDAIYRRLIEVSGRGVFTPLERESMSIEGLLAEALKTRTLLEQAWQSFGHHLSSPSSTCSA